VDVGTYWPGPGTSIVNLCSVPGSYRFPYPILLLLILTRRVVTTFSLFRYCSDIGQGLVDAGFLSTVQGPLLNYQSVTFLA